MTAYRIEDEIKGSTFGRTTAPSTRPRRSATQRGPSPSSGCPVLIGVILPSARGLAYASLWAASQEAG
jgi:hypothetical protein